MYVYQVAAVCQTTLINEYDGGDDDISPCDAKRVSVGLYIIKFLACRWCSTFVLAEEVTYGAHSLATRMVTRRSANADCTALRV